jgi:hypothetical protein
MLSDPTPSVHRWHTKFLPFSNRVPVR